MTNLFENAKFGDIYLSNDEKENVFCSFTTSGNDDLARLYREGWGVIVSDLDGTVHIGTEFGKGIDFTIKGRQEETDYLKLFSSLPHLDGECHPIDDWGYTPTLYHFDTQWFVDWIHFPEGDSLLSYSGKTPEEAIMKAWHYIQDIIKLKSLKL